ncbi:MAG: hypothetical protein R6V53_00635 [Candidatus Woesearchaeota archaeon]
MKKILLLTLFLTVLLSACTLDRSEDTDENYRSGSQGLYMQFMPNMPPSQIYDDEEFSTMIEIHNKGAHDLETGSNSQIYLSGFDKNIITGVNEGKRLMDLEGKSMYNNQGEFSSIEFDGAIRSLDARNIDKYDFNLVATACYSYKTIAEPTVCIDPDPYSTTAKNKACDSKINPSVGSQGAPVAVSSIEMEPLKGRTKFKIHVDNVGGGTVFKQGYSHLTSCSPYSPDGLEYKDINYVTVTAVEIANSDIRGTCRPLDNGELKLINGHGYFVCEVTGLAGPAYTTPLRIELEYGYRQEISRPVTIIATP